MKDFKNLDEIKKIDPQDTFGSTMGMIAQFEAAWVQVNKVVVPKTISIQQIWL